MFELQKDTPFKVKLNADMCVVVLPKTSKIMISVSDDDITWTDVAFVVGTPYTHHAIAGQYVMAALDEGADAGGLIKLLRSGDSQHRSSQQQQ